MAKKRKHVKCKRCKKNSYRSEHEAYRILLAAVEQRQGTGLRVYCCPVGRGWHLTSQRPVGWGES